MTPEWATVPWGHRGRDYHWTPGGVRVSCPCTWESTLARDVPDALQLWGIHIRQVKRGWRP